MVWSRGATWSPQNLLMLFINIPITPIITMTGTTANIRSTTSVISIASDLSNALHQRANDPDHHDRRDDGHYQVHYLLHLQVSNSSHLAVSNYEML